MRVIVQVSGQISIDINGLYGEPVNENGAGLAPEHARARESSAGPAPARARAQESGAGQPDLDLTDIASLEQALVLTLAMLLAHHHDQSAEPPSYAVIAGCTKVLHVLVERGEIASPSARDVSFLSQLVAILEALADHSPRPFMTDLIASIRALLDDLDDDAGGDDDDDDDDGNSGPGDDEPGPGGNTPGGNNGTPGNGVPHDSSPDDDTWGDGSPGDDAPDDGTPGNGTPGNGTPGNGTPGDGGAA